jgi:antibiotic biosynthesis monooxygenase (ABM) superfamily enzyme
MYNGKAYDAGTKFIYTGRCMLNQEETFLDRAVVSFMYSCGLDKYFTDGNNVYSCQKNEFDLHIVSIIIDENKSPPNDKTEIYWTDSMVTKTIWYIVVMLAAVLFNERIGIWIFATIIWYNSMFNKK